MRKSQAPKQHGSPGTYPPGDPKAAARHDAWQDFMIWYLLRRRPTVAVTTGEEVDPLFVARGARVTKSDDTDVVSGIPFPTEVIMDTVIFDNGDYWNPTGGGGSGALEISEAGQAGMYYVSLNTVWANQGNVGAHLNHIWVTNVPRNPPPYIAKAAHGHFNGTSHNEVCCSAVFPLFVGDAVRVRVMQVTGANVLLKSVSGVSPVLSIVRIGPFEGTDPVDV